MSSLPVLEPTSEVDTTVRVGDEYVAQVRTYAALGYSIKRIVQLLGLRGKVAIALKVRMSLPGDVYSDAYQQGQALGEYNIDSELAKKAEQGDVDAITLLEERKNQRKEIDLRKELFGV